MNEKQFQIIYDFCDWLGYQGLAYETLYYLENKYYNNFEELIRLTEYLVNKVKNLI